MHLHYRWLCTDIEQTKVSACSACDWWFESCRGCCSAHHRADSACAACNVQTLFQIRHTGSNGGADEAEIAILSSTNPEYTSSPRVEPGGDISSNKMSRLELKYLHPVVIAANCTSGSLGSLQSGTPG